MKKLLTLALHIAVEAAQDAGALQRSRFRQSFSVNKKAATDLVTEVDIASEKIIVEKIKASFPEHTILAEEGGESVDESDYRWIIDPLDGTTNFAHGFPLFAVSIALEYKGEVQLGVVYLPVLDEMFTAKLHEGAFLNGEAIRVSDKKPLINSLLATGFAYNFQEMNDNNIVHFRNFLLKSRAVRRPGAAAVDLVYTACGIFEGFWERGLNPWDVAAGVLIVLEAGGQVSQYSGEAHQVDSRNIVASNGLIHQSMIEVLNRLDTEKTTLLEEDIVIYLAENPEALIHFPDLYEKLIPPRKEKGSGENVLNFHHRLINSLQASNKKLREELQELFLVASENEMILSHLDAIESLMYGSRSLTELLKSVSSEIEKRFSFTFAYVSLIGQNIASAEETHFQPIVEVQEGDKVVLYRSVQEFPLSFPQKQPRIYNGGGVDDVRLLFKNDGDSLASGILLPLWKDDTLLGSLNLGSPKEGHFHEGFGTDFLESFAEKFSVCIVNLINREVIDEKMLQDEETGLYNRAFLGSILPFEINRAGHYHYPLSLLLINVDNIKGVVEREGEKQVRSLICELAELLQEQTGKADILVRFMGDEFALLLSGRDQNDALEFAEKLRRMVEETCFCNLLSPLSITVSIGVSSFFPGSSERVVRKKDLIEAADKALYVAKTGGRNRVA